MCTKVSSGCLNCYASDMNVRFDPMKRPYLYGENVYGDWEYELSRTMINNPYTWHDPRMIFVCSMMDLFHEKVPDEFIQKIFAIMDCCSRHTYQILTKRPKRMMKFVESYYRHNPYMLTHENIWLGVTAENQEMLNLRVPYLLQTRAAKLFVSYEPALEAIDFSSIPYQGDTKYYLNPLIQRYSVMPQVGECDSSPFIHGLSNLGGIDWLIFGCESGAKRRPCNIDWIKNGVDQCREAGVPAFVKQLNIDGKVIKEIERFPADLRVRQWPKG